MAEARSPGFTLLELLVALAVLGFLLVGLNQGTRLGVSAWDAQSRLVAARDQLDAADRALRLLLAHVDPGTGRTPLRLAGKPDSFEFATELPSAVALATRRADVTLLVDGRHRLILRWTPHLHERRLGEAPAEDEAEILSGVKEIRFSYWHQADQSGAAGWRNQWSEPVLPDLVKIHLVFAAGDRRRWPEIVVAPMLDHPAG
jgi:general secretion pathway protein J